jgi:DNA (cytosine-5)-methyltransferase 1
MSDARLYKQAGNSVSVPVIQKIAENIMKALNKEKEIIKNNELSQIRIFD